MAIFYLFLGNGCRKKVRTLKIKKVDDKPERAEAEQVEAEVVYSSMVAEPQEYQYNADAFEARGADEVKQEVAHKKWFLL